MSGDTIKKAYCKLAAFRFELVTLSCTYECSCSSLKSVAARVANMKKVLQQRSSFGWTPPVESLHTRLSQFFFCERTNRNKDGSSVHVKPWRGVDWETVSIHYHKLPQRVLRSSLVLLHGSARSLSRSPGPREHFISNGLLTALNRA